MPVITLAQAETMLAEAIVNLTAVRTSERWKTGDVDIQRSMLSSANNDVMHWNEQVARLTRGGIKIMGVRFND